MIENLDQNQEAEAEKKPSISARAENKRNFTGTREEEPVEDESNTPGPNFNNINIQNQYNNIIHIDNQEILRDLLLTSPRTMHKKAKPSKRNEREKEHLSDLIEQDEEDNKDETEEKRDRISQMPKANPNPKPIFTKSSNLSIDNSSIPQKASAPII